MLSNFEYLMRGNVFGGRSYADRYLYPLFPAVVEEFDFTRSRKFPQVISDIILAMSGTDTLQG
jgi:hypothetical protein